MTIFFGTRPGPAIDLCGAHSSAKQLKKLQLVAKESAPPSWDAFTITEQLHMTIFLTDDAWLGN
jgi:hypothetical protein